MATLTTLPTELLEHIISYLAATDSPSSKFLREEPTLSLLTTQPAPLKDLSCTSKRMRDLSFYKLFVSLRIGVYDLSGLGAFITANRLREHCNSVLVYTSGQDDSNLGNHASTLSTATLRASSLILKFLNPEILILLLPLKAFELLIPYQLDLTDAWAFKAPYHILLLSQTGSPDLHPSPEYLRSAQPLHQSNDDFFQPGNILAARRWTSMTCNEGSSISVFSVYEYYHKRSPSILVPAFEADRKRLCVSLTHVTSFDFIAVFPSTYGRSITTECLREMVNLQILRVQCAPTSNNNVLDDQTRLGTCQRSDLWAEFERNYCVFFNFLRKIAPISLVLFSSLDYGISELRSIIRSTGDTLADGWQHDGEGNWTRAIADKLDA
ncbi:hypothetical protein MMC21_006554 [Puttea exsequens]|nr:hypothetical protein [Puttea exsequens]